MCFFCLFCLFYFQFWECVSVVFSTLSHQLLVFWLSGTKFINNIVDNFSRWSFFLAIAMAIISSNTSHMHLHLCKGGTHCKRNWKLIDKRCYWIAFTRFSFAINIWSVLDRHTGDSHFFSHQYSWPSNWICFTTLISASIFHFTFFSLRFFFPFAECERDRFDWIKTEWSIIWCRYMYIYIHIYTYI